MATYFALVPSDHEDNVRLGLVVSSMATPKLLLALYVAAVGEGDASCMEVVIVVGVDAAEGVAISIGGVVIIVMLQDDDTGERIDFLVIATIVACVGFVGGVDDVDVDVTDEQINIDNIGGVFWYRC